MNGCGKARMTATTPEQARHRAARRADMGTQRTEMDEYLSREDRVLAKLRRRVNEHLAQKPPEPAMWPVIVIGLAAGMAMLAAGIVIDIFL
jgi:hypothetical protein